MLAWASWKNDVVAGNMAMSGFGPPHLRLSTQRRARPGCLLSLSWSANLFMLGAVATERAGFKSSGLCRSCMLVVEWCVGATRATGSSLELQQRIVRKSRVFRYRSVRTRVICGFYLWGFEWGFFCGYVRRTRRLYLEWVVLFYACVDYYRRRHCWV